jgi:Rieske Fe-S protein
LTSSLGGSLVGPIIAFLYPAIRYILRAKQTEAVVKKITAAKVGKPAPNTSKIFKFGTSPGILIFTPDGELKAFSGICTHLTCTIIYESDTGTILCFCHNGRFYLSGNVISGYPPAPLESYDVEISGEDIIISKEGV